MKKEKKRKEKICVKPWTTVGRRSESSRDAAAAAAANTIAATAC